MPRDLLQLYPLDGRLVMLCTTEDDSCTRLILSMRYGAGHPPAASIRTELGVQDAQHLARELMQWLADCGHPLPNPPAGWVLQEQELDDDSETPVPENITGELLVRDDRQPATGLPVPIIERADPWVLIHQDLWNSVVLGDGQYAQVQGDRLTIADARGAVVVYERRAHGQQPDTWACERIDWRPAGQLPEHHRG